jgi:hypothetical protein
MNSKRNERVACFADRDPSLENVIIFTGLISWVPCHTRPYTYSTDKVSTNSTLTHFGPYKTPILMYLMAVPNEDTFRAPTFIPSFLVVSGHRREELAERASPVLPRGSCPRDLASVRTVNCEFSAFDSLISAAKTLSIRPSCYCHQGSRASLHFLVRSLLWLALLRCIFLSLTQHVAILSRFASVICSLIKSSLDLAFASPHSLCLSFTPLGLCLF